MKYILMLLVPWMSFLASAAGGNSGASWLVYRVGTSFGAFWGSAASRLPEIVWAISIAAVSTLVFGLGWYGALVFIPAYLAMETGHGNAFHDGVAEKLFSDRWQTLDYIVRPITNLLKFAPRSKWYCRVFMGIKGLLIGAPILWFGIPLVVLWPAAYAISFRTKGDSEYAELISGACMGLMLYITLLVM